MQKALRHFHQPSPLSVVFVVTLAILLAAAVMVVVGVAELLGLESDGLSGALPFVGRPF
jgi:hypothetical protein